MRHVRRLSYVRPAGCYRADVATLTFLQEPHPVWSAERLRALRESLAGQDEVVRGVRRASGEIDLRQRRTRAPERPKRPHTGGQRPWMQQAPAGLVDDHSKDDERT